MKKVLIVIATIVLMCSMLALTTFADGPSSAIGPNPIDLNNVTSSQVQDIANHSQQLTQGTNLEGSGNKILDSDIWKSFVLFLQNLTTAIAIACPIICGVFIIIYASRMSMADEQDHPRWKKRIIVCFVVAVVGASGSGIIALLLSYVPT